MNTKLLFLIVVNNYIICQESYDYIKPDHEEIIKNIDNCIKFYKEEKKLKKFQEKIKQSMKNLRESCEEISNSIAKEKIINGMELNCVDWHNLIQENRKKFHESLNIINKLLSTKGKEVNDFYSPLGELYLSIGYDQKIRQIIRDLKKIKILLIHFKIFTDYTHGYLEKIKTLYNLNKSIPYKNFKNIVLLHVLKENGPINKIKNIRNEMKSYVVKNFQEENLKSMMAISEYQKNIAEKTYLHKEFAEKSRYIFYPFKKINELQKYIHIHFFQYSLNSVENELLKNLLPDAIYKLIQNEKNIFIIIRILKNFIYLLEEKAPIEKIIDKAIMLKNKLGAIELKEIFHIPYKNNSKYEHYQ